MSFNKMLIAVTFVLASSVVTAAKQDNSGEYSEWKNGNAGVNWSKGRLEANGVGMASAKGKPASIKKKLACRAAYVDAQRNLVEAIKGVRVQSTTVVNDFMSTSDEIRLTIEGVIHGAEIISEKIMDDGTCEVQVVAPLEGNITSAVYSRAFEGVKDSKKSSRVVKKKKVQKMIDKIGFRPTGVILDARGSNFLPSMSPRIYRTKGGVVYPIKAVRDAVIKDGKLVSLFAKKMDYAKSHPSVGKKPLIIKAVHIPQDSRTDLAISDESATDIERLVEEGIFWDVGVIIVF